MASDDSVAGDDRVNESAGDPGTGPPGTAPCRPTGMSTGTEPFRGISTRRYRRAAARISSVTLSGWLIMATCELRISTVLAPARAAMARSASGGIVRSLRATRYQDGIVFQAGGPDGDTNRETAAGRWLAAISAVCRRGKSCANRSWKN